MQLGFVIDHTKCIGCHACTVACKSENQVPLGNFRTWVKYTEEGEFPKVKRSFAVLRCNQCTAAPCIEICPVNALEKRPDGIVDVDPARCIGCKACMQGCPYDALYLNESSGTAEKCHFCAHRTEIGLAPACAVVCPTEAIIPGDFHDPESMVSKLAKEHNLAGRKTEAGTGPNVLYREVSEAGINPQKTNIAGGYLWANSTPGTQLEAETFHAKQDESKSLARTTYQVDHPARWGWKITGYLFLKSLAAGIFLILAVLSVLSVLGGQSMPPGTGAFAAGAMGRLSLGALIFLGLTMVFLLADLKRPERFLYILLKPNWSSWLTRGSFVLAGYGALLTLILALPLLIRLPGAVMWTLTGLGTVLAAFSACYTGWLFGQAKGRVLWMRRGLWAHLIVQAMVAGAALVLLGHRQFEVSMMHLSPLRWTLVGSLMVHFIFILTEHKMAPKNREPEYSRTVALLTRGPFARRRYVAGILVGIALPGVLLLFPNVLWAWNLAAVGALIGLYFEEDIMVKAGQALPLS